MNLLASLPESFNMLVKVLEPNTDIPSMDELTERSDPCIYRHNLLQKFCMENAKPVKTPVDTCTKLVKATEVMTEKILTI